MPAVEFPPGITTQLSKTAKIANWYDGNLVRWDDGVTLRPVSGWEKINYPTPFASRVRAMHKWISQSGILWTAYLCEAHVYVDTGNSLTDITPIGGMAPLPELVAGYGEYEYGDYITDDPNLYGTPRVGPSHMQKFSPAWSINNWGEDLLVMTNYDGRLLRWKMSDPGGKLVVVPNAPIANRQFVVTPQHHCILFQMEGNLADFGWCSEEDIEDWDFANPYNTAGMYTLDPFSPIVAAHSSAAGVAVYTPAMMHFVEFIGLPYIYRYKPVAKVPIPISAAAVSSIPEGIIWISIEGFWIYNGSTANIIKCPVWDIISTRMDFQRTVRESHSINLLSRGEIWWFWVDPIIGLECTRYVALDYRSNVWMSGYLKRTCGVTFANDMFPLMSDGWSVWKHETGFTYPGALYMPYLESQSINVLGGEVWNTIVDIIPEIAGDRRAVAFSLAMTNDRTTNVTKYSRKRTANEHGKVDIRETARDVRLRIDMIQNSDWQTVGPIIFNIKPRGKKR